MVLIDHLIQQWLVAGVELRPGASSEAIVEVEQLLRVPLPADARAFYEKANGMRDFAHDQWFVSVWACERILSENYVRRGADDRGEYTDVGFADVMISSWHLWFRVRDHKVSIFVDSTAEEFASFGSFLARYLQSPGSLGLLKTGEASQ
jgi:hypothetical protein